MSLTINLHFWGFNVARAGHDPDAPKVTYMGQRMCKCTNVVLYSVLRGLVSSTMSFRGYRAHAPRAPLGPNDVGGNVCIVGQHTRWVPGIAPRACLHEAGAVSVETGV